MSEKRTDNKGRILKGGEYQRKNGTYEYRYLGIRGKSQAVYAKTLVALRKKAEAVQRDVADGIDYSAGEILVAELIDKSMNLRRNLSENTRRAYGTAIKRILESDFSEIQVKNVKPSDAKLYLIDLHDQGLKRNTISIFHNVLRPAFEMAVDDDIIRKNPFKFKLSDLFPDDTQKRVALTSTQQAQYLSMVQACGGIYYNDILLLLGTGVRVSELYGLTKKDLDFTNRCIRVERQLCRTADKPYFITTTKTKSGIRNIPMSPKIYTLLKQVLAERGTPKTEMIVDGIGGFLFLDKDSKPKVGMHLQNHMRKVQKEVIRQHCQFPTVTPHVLRHTFCTNLQQAGIDVKSLQYLMGHSNVSVTLDIYTHTNYDVVKESFSQAVANL